MVEIYTFDEIFAIASTLNPQNAVSMNQVEKSRCVTPLFQRVRVAGAEVELKPLLVANEKRFGAGYVRVSTPSQYSDGFSVDDQIKNVIKYFLDKKLAFRIYNDAPMSGALPYNDPALITRLVEAKIRLYTSVFERVFLSPLRLQSYTPAREESVRGYLKQRVAKLLGADPAEEVELRPRFQSRTQFRPALTCLIEDMPHLHTLLVNDLTRLSRNQYLFAEIAHTIEQHKTKVVGIMENLDFMNGSSGEMRFGDQIQGWILATMAEHRLQETMLGDLRGLLERLEQGKAIGSVPSWIERIVTGPQKGETRLKAGAQEVIAKVHDVFLTERLGSYQLMNRLTELRVPCLSRHGTWTQEIARSMITSRALAGYQTEFGLEFPVFEPVVSEERWQELNCAWHNRPDNRINLAWTQGFEYHPATHKTNYLATSLMRCTCAATTLREGYGGALTYRPCEDPQRRCYVCGNARRKKDQRHIILNDENVHQFINGLMATDPQVFLGQHQTHATYHGILTELRDTEQAMPEAQASVMRRREEIEQQATEQAAGLGFVREDAGWSDVISGLVKNYLVKDKAATRLRKLQEERERLIRNLREFAPQEQATALTERIAHWNDLEIWEKNNLVLRIFDRWEFRKVNDLDSDLQMVMVLRGGQELPPVAVTVLGRGKRLLRRLPAVEEWIGSVLSDQRSKRSSISTYESAHQINLSGAQ